MEKWYAILEPILQNFIDAKNGVENDKFWSDICRFQPGYVRKEAFVDGWITAFNVFDNGGNWQGTVRKGKQWPVIDIKDWASGVVTVPVKIDYATKEYDSVMFAGHM